MIDLYWFSFIWLPHLIVHLPHSLYDLIWTLPGCQEFALHGGYQHQYSVPRLELPGLGRLVVCGLLLPLSGLHVFPNYGIDGFHSVSHGPHKVD